MYGPDALELAKAASGQFRVLLDGLASLQPAHVLNKQLCAFWTCLRKR
jgi:hypothetical protein